MKKLKIKRKAYADGTTAVGVVGDEDMSASSLRGDDLSAWNAAKTQAEKDKILADANAKKTAKNNAATSSHRHARFGGASGFAGMAETARSRIRD